VGCHLHKNALATGLVILAQKFGIFGNVQLARKYTCILRAYLRKKQPGFSIDWILKCTQSSIYNLVVPSKKLSVFNKF
jgi:hypothetical protein